jgi:hypothetical protein
MEAQAGWGAAMFFVALAAAHGVEQVVAECRAAKGGCSIAGFKGLVGDRLGSLLLLLALATAGVLIDEFWLWLALGIVGADFAQHAASSIRIRAYTPGVATGAFLLVYLLYFIADSAAQASWEKPSAWGAMVIGIAFVALGYLSTPKKSPES